jgi:hypothetical protein
MSIKCKIGLHNWESSVYSPRLECSRCGMERVVHINKKAIIRKLIIEYQRSGGSITSASLIRIGKYLNKKGGYELMLDIANEAVSFGVSSYWFNAGWDRIGNWRA